MSTESKRTLYADESHARFFYIPAEADLLEGDFKIGTLSGQFMTTTEDSVKEFEIDETFAKDIANGVVKTVAETAGRFMTSAGELLRNFANNNPFDENADRRKARESNVAEFLGITKEQLQGDPQAVLDGLKEIGRGLKSAMDTSISESPVSVEGAKVRMEAFANYAKDELGISIGDNPADLPQQLADVLSNPELEASVRASTERLRNLASQIRSASATVDEMDRSSDAEETNTEE